MFINVSNHASTKWSKKQLDAAKALTTDGRIVDIPFPNVDPNVSDVMVSTMANNLVDEILSQGKIDAVMIMGELSLCYNAINELFQSGLRVVVATTERKAVEKVNPDGTTSKQVIFDFVQFREV